MAEPTKPSTKTGALESAAAGSVSTTPDGVQEEQKPKYSKGLKTAQKMEKSMSKAQRRIAKAVHKSFEVWEQERDKSALKHKDGAIRDVVKNSAKAYEQAMKVAVRAPRDLLKGVSPLKPRKMMRLFFFPFV